MRIFRINKRMVFCWVLAVALGILLLPGFVCAEEKPANGSQPLVTATFFDSDLREALREVAIQTGVNMTVDENVRGLVTLELKEVPLEKALRMMLISGGYSFRKIDDFYIIGWADPKNPAFAGLSETEVYYFKNISAESAKAMLPNFYTPYVKFGTGKDGQETAIVTAAPELLRKIIEDLKKMDGQKQQVKIKALVTEISNEVLKEWGLNILNLDFTQPGSGWKSIGLNTSTGLHTLKEQGDFGSLEATIKALVTEKKATIHADPVIIVTEGKSGDLFVGEKRTLILYSQGTNSTTSTTENVEAGTTLKVIPKLVGDQIELAVTQKISDFDDGSSDEITVKSREFNSVIRLLPRQTVLVAGLTEKRMRNNVSKTPILGDIPIIGLLFKQKADKKGDSELLIFLTAEVI